MVDTPKNGGGDNPSKRGGGPHNRGGDNGNNNGRGGNNDDGNDYNPDDDADKSLDSDDEDSLNESLGNPNYDALRLRQVTTAKRIKNMSHCLRDEENYLNDRWTELFQAEEALKVNFWQLEANNDPRCHRRNLLGEMDVVAQDSTIFRRQWVENLD